MIIKTAMKKYSTASRRVEYSSNIGTVVKLSKVLRSTSTVLQVVKSRSTIVLVVRRTVVVQ